MIQVDLITGFLGAGKTTFIIEYAKYLVRIGKKVAIIVSDHGAINVDRILLEKALGAQCHLEMVIAQDTDCGKRRLKTKLITMAMERYDRVLVEPSGIFEVDDFFDLLYEEPLERWYSKGNVITIAEANHKENSMHARYLMASQISMAGCVILSKTGKDIGKEDVRKNLDYMNEILLQFHCKRRIEDIYLWQESGISDEDFEEIANCGYFPASVIKLPGVKEENYQSLFFFHVKITPDTLEETIRELFHDQRIGHLIRLKGYIQNGQEWLEVNATENEISITKSSIGQEVMIAIGEKLNQSALERYIETEESPQ